MKVAKRQTKEKRTKPETKRAGKAPIGQLFNFARDSYLERTSRPIYAIGFLLPFVIFYEVGTILINTDILNQSEIRVVAFVWLRDLLESIGFGGKFAWVAPPLVVVAILAGLQVSSRKRWTFDVRDTVPMAAECIVLAVPLIVLSLLLNNPHVPQNRLDRFAAGGLAVYSSQPTATVDQLHTLPLLAAQSNLPRANHMLLANVVTGVGAGIYEELVFRLILICLLMMLFQDIFGLDQKNSIVLSVLISATLFSAHHHIDLLTGRANPTEPFDFTRFAFRAMAGIYFAILFAIRGFGITAGTHAFYDIIATIINALFFER